MWKHDLGASGSISTGTRDNYGQLMKWCGPETATDGKKGIYLSSKIGSTYKSM